MRHRAGWRCDCRTTRRRVGLRASLRRCEGASSLPGWTGWSDYERSWLRGDVVAGITVAAYLIPQVMAYAEVAGLPAVTGLWACSAR